MSVEANTPCASDSNALAPRVALFGVRAQGGPIKEGATLWLPLIPVIRTVLDRAARTDTLDVSISNDSLRNAGTSDPLRNIAVTFSDHDGGHDGGHRVARTVFFDGAVRLIAGPASIALEGTLNGEPTWLTLSEGLRQVGAANMREDLKRLDAERDVPTLRVLDASDRLGQFLRLQAAKTSGKNESCGAAAGFSARFIEEYGAAVAEEQRWAAAPHFTPPRGTHKHLFSEALGHTICQSIGAYPILGSIAPDFFCDGDWHSDYAYRCPGLTPKLVRGLASALTNYPSLGARFLASGGWTRLQHSIARARDLHKANSALGDEADTNEALGLATAAERQHRLLATSFGAGTASMAVRACAGRDEAISMGRL